MTRRAVWLAIAVLAAAGAALWWLAAARGDEGTLSRLRREGVIRIGYAVEAPYVFFDAGGRLTGTEVELSRLVASRLAIPRVEWYQTEFGSLIGELRAGRFDAVAAGMFITPDRSRLVSFSEPTFRAGPALLVGRGNPLGLHAYAQVIESRSLTMAVLNGSVEQAMIRAAGMPDSRLLVVPDALTGRVAVESGLASCLALSSPTVRFIARNQALGATEAARPFTPPAGGGVGVGAVAFRSGDDRLREAWNRQLRHLVGSPAHRRLLAEFGLGDEELPGGATTAALLAGERR